MTDQLLSHADIWSVPHNVTVQNHYQSHWLMEKKEITHQKFKKL